MLTGRQLFDSGMLIGADESAVQQQGVDIRIDKISKILGMGIIPKEGKTTLPKYKDMDPLHYKDRDSGRTVFGWMLPAGVYDIVFMEGVKVDERHCMKPLTRSSLVRCGARVDSGLYDAGFETSRAGAMLYVSNPILIEKGARVAQIVCGSSDEVKNLYDGQFQGDKQRKE